MDHKTTKKPAKPVRAAKPARAVKAAKTVKAAKPAPAPADWLADYLAGRSRDCWEELGAHPCVRDGQEGWRFRVWAPRAREVSVIGDFNGWDRGRHPMTPLRGGVWETFIPGLARYDTYKFAILSPDGEELAKADPYAFHAETRPGTASKLYDIGGYPWGDKKWMAWRGRHLVYHSPMNIYEVHLGSWRRTGEGEFLSYRDMAAWLVPYVKEMGFTHVELMPVTEHPLDASWGYQCTGYFAPTSRFGTPHDFMYLVDQLHQAGVGVILDWVPAHFPRDAFGLYQFDGTPTYEYADPRKGTHQEWGTQVFDYGRPEVRSFLTASALFWLERYHIDGLRVDAVASMLYLDYGRQGGEWVPNEGGGNENWEAVSFLRHLNRTVFSRHPDVLMVAEESTAWPHVTGVLDSGKDALGFNLKWNMGWMNDVLHYTRLDPYFRQFNHRDVTFSLMYAFSENFVLPISHDEVVHMKGSLLNKMPGDDSQKYAGVRAFYTYMLTHPGKKLLIMGSEFGQWNEWHYEQSLDWHLLDMDNEDGERHRRLQAFFKAANAFYLAHSQLWELDFSWEGFQWIHPDDNSGNVLLYLRKDRKGEPLLIAVNFSPVHRKGYRVGVPIPGTYQLLFNSDDAAFGGTGAGDTEPLVSLPAPCHGCAESIQIDLPPLSGVIYRCARKKSAAQLAAQARRAPKVKPALPGASGPEKKGD